jgi:hypothetical protein
MKTKKLFRILSVLLTLALGSALLVPASAIPNPDYVPTITQQPPERLCVVQGDEIKLEIKAEAPKESDGSPLRYQWTQYEYIDWGPGGFVAIEGARESTLTLPTPVMYLNDADSLYLRCEVTATLKDGSEAVVTSETCWVFLYYDWDGAMAKVREAWDNGREFGTFAAFSYVIQQLYALAVTPVAFVQDWRNYESIRSL